MNKQKKGAFITIEGIEGVGKSTSLKFIKRCLGVYDIPLIMTREPGGTPIAEDIRKVLLHHHEEEMSIDTELLLMFAGRAQHINTVIRPALNAGQWVLCDRFTDASYAYQGGGRAISENRIQQLEQWVHADLQPDLTLLLDAPVKIALTRARRRGQPDRIEKEKKAFFLRVQKKYHQRMQQFPERFRLIDASQPIVKMRQNLKNTIEQFVETRK